MSERHIPQSHSRVKPTASKNNILPSEKQDGGKVPANATANDSQAVVNYNRQQRHNQNNNTNKDQNRSLMILKLTEKDGLNMI